VFKQKKSQFPAFEFIHQTVCQLEVNRAYSKTRHRMMLFSEIN